MAVKKSEIYSSLWASCDKLRGGMDASQYKDYILTLLLDYIILHELVHLRVKNHNTDFIALMDSYMPFWKDVKKKLNEQILDCWIVER